jgi:predicted Na+-dependent transporter
VSPFVVRAEIMTMTMMLLLLLKLAVGVIIFAIGLDSTARDTIRLLHRPSLLLRSLLAMYVLVPLVAFLLVRTMSLAPAVQAGLLVLAVSAGAPLLPRKVLGVGDGAYIFSLVVISSLLAIVLVPLWLAMLGPQFGRHPDLRAVDVALVLAKSFFVPLLAGMAVRWLFPAFAKGLASRLMAIAGLALGLSAVVLLALHWQVVASVEGNGILALAALIVTALAVGHFLGGPAEDDRSVLAIACATRHIGIAVLVAASLPGPRTAVIIAVYIVTSAAISIPYIRWRRAVAARKPAASPAGE